MTRKSFDFGDDIVVCLQCCKSIWGEPHTDCQRISRETIYKYIEESPDKVLELEKMSIEDMGNELARASRLAIEKSRNEREIYESLKRAEEYRKKLLIEK